MQRILVGSYILKFETLASTNDFCKDYYKEKGAAALSVAVIAKNQTAGRGQRGNTWHTKNGENLTFSAICNTSFLSTSEVFYLNKAISVAICKSLEEYQINAEIKWPNDIYVENKKIGGILIESSLQGNQLSHSIIGIGLNVNEVDFPKEIKACSIKNVSGKHHDLNEIFENVLNQLDLALWKIKQNTKSLDTEYFKRLLGKDLTLVFEDKNGIFTGIIRDVSENGLLIIEHGEEIKQYDFKEVRFLI